MHNLEYLLEELANYDEKECSSCKIIKPYNKFYRSNRGLHKLQAECVDCKVKYNNKWRHRKYQTDVNFRHKRYLDQIKYKYGITENDYSNLISSQANKCWICE